MIWVGSLSHRNCPGSHYISSSLGVSIINHGKGDHDFNLVGITKHHHPFYGNHQIPLLKLSTFRVVHNNCETIAFMFKDALYITFCIVFIFNEIPIGTCSPILRPTLLKIIDLLSISAS